MTPLVTVVTVVPAAVFVPPVNDTFGPTNPLPAVLVVIALTPLLGLRTAVAVSVVLS